MTLTQIIAAVRSLLDDDQFDQTAITRAANWNQSEIFNNTRTRLMEASATMSADAGDTTVDFPSDMQTMINLYVTVPQVYEIDDYYIPYGDFVREYPNFASLTPVTIKYWTDFGNAMRFSAPLDVDHTFAIDYVRRPVAMSRGADVCEIPDAYSEIIVRGTLARVMEQNEDYGEASNERQNIAPLITTFIRNEGRGQVKTGPVVMRSNRRRTGNRDGWR